LYFFFFVKVNWFYSHSTFLTTPIQSHLGPTSQRFLFGHSLKPSCYFITSHRALVPFLSHSLSQTRSLFTRPAFCLHLFYFINKKVKFILDPIIYKYLYFDALGHGVSMTLNLQKDSVWSLYLLSLNLEVTISWCLGLLWEHELHHFSNQL
jgi:hypothetical protein